jgi:AmmeMemoRadiSam system protein A
MSIDQGATPDGGKADVPSLSEESRKYLKDIAREAVADHVKGGVPQPLTYDDPILKNPWGVFVTLKINGNLRGCIGNIVSDRAIPETVTDMAVKSASMDPRFPPIGPAELENLDIDISILGPLSEVKDHGEIEIGVHGLVIEQGGRRGLLLPQVAVEHNLNVTQFIEQTCVKAGLPPDAWQQGARILKFAAEFF